MCATNSPRERYQNARACPATPYTNSSKAWKKFKRPSTHRATALANWVALRRRWSKLLKPTRCAQTGQTQHTRTVCANQGQWCARLGVFSLTGAGLWIEHVFMAGRWIFTICATAAWKPTRRGVDRKSCPGLTYLCILAPRFAGPTGHTSRSR